jgi:glycosyltransferase involved in cell wall biosynthesis
MLSASSHTPDISVITVCKDAGDDFCLTFQSVLSQVNIDLEFIVQDGASRDLTLAFLRDNPDPRIKLASQPDHGIYDAMNLAVQRASGKWCIFLNAGDLFLRNTSLSEMLNEIEERESIDLFISSCFNALERTETVYPLKLSRYFLFQSTVCHQVQLWRTKNLSNFLPFDNRFKIYADQHLLIKALTSGISVYSSRKAYISYKDSGFSARPEMQILKQKERREVLKECFSNREYRIYSMLNLLTFQKARLFLLNPLRGTYLFRLYRYLTNPIRRLL